MRLWRFLVWEWKNREYRVFIWFILVKIGGTCSRFVHQRFERLERFCLYLCVWLYYVIVSLRCSKNISRIQLKPPPNCNQNSCISFGRYITNLISNWLCWHSHRNIYFDASKRMNGKMWTVWETQGIAYYI